MSFLEIVGLPEEIKAAACYEEHSLESEQEDHDRFSVAGSIKPRVALNGWRIMVQADAKVLWTSLESRELWKFHGLNADELMKHWSANTFVWILPLIKEANSCAQRMYAKRVSRLRQAMATLQEKMRHSQLDAGKKKYKHLLEPTFSIPLVAKPMSTILSVEREGDSLAFEILRKRPDLMIAKCA